MALMLEIQWYYYMSHRNIINLVYVSFQYRFPMILKLIMVIMSLKSYFRIYHWNKQCDNVLNTKHRQLKTWLLVQNQKVNNKCVFRLRRKIWENLPKNLEAHQHLFQRWHFLQQKLFLQEFTILQMTWWICFYDGIWWKTKFPSFLRHGICTYRSKSLCISVLEDKQSIDYGWNNHWCWRNDYDKGRIAMYTSK